ncbi:hypothetical protein KBG31_01725 [Patescibacteria group bacterium]|nr:hypothetical protein [Patescibacteria group bacterium]HOM77949.1 hypothetical protein [bacterium]
MKQREFNIINTIGKIHWWYKRTRAVSLMLLENFLPMNSGNPNLIIYDGGTGCNMKALQKYGQVTGSDSSEYAVELFHLKCL